MTDRPAVALDPWETLPTVGKLSLMLGAFSLARLGTEIVQLFIYGIGHVNNLYLVLVLCDVPPAILWVVSGRMLRYRTPKALAATVTAAGISGVDALVSVFTIAPLMGEFVINRTPLEPLVSAIFAARLLLYALQILYSPLALMMVLRKYPHRGIPDGYRAVTRRSLWIVLLMTILLTLPPQIVLKIAVMKI